MEEYRRMNSPVHAFVHDCLVEQKPGEPTQEIEKSKLYAAFSSYCGKNGYGRHHAENFWKELGQVLKHIKRVRKRVGEERIRVISGIKFKVDVKFGNDAGE
jgi:phage/plasmid-associated DNA primase